MTIIHHVQDILPGFLTALASLYQLSIPGLLNVCDGAWHDIRAGPGKQKNLKEEAEFNVQSHSSSDAVFP